MSGPTFLWSPARAVVRTCSTFTVLQCTSAHVFCLFAVSHMKDVQAMNIVPESWIVKVLSQHYHAVSMTVYCMYDSTLYV